MLTILLPVDFSQNANNAVRYALQLTKKLPCRYIFFHTEIIPVPVSSDVTVLPIAFNEEGNRENLSSQVEKIFKSLKIKPDPKTITWYVSQGISIGSQILDAADKQKADLIIMGTEGASGLKKVLMGSNTVDVIARAKVPVISVPESYRYKPMKKILHASDLKQLNNELTVAVDWARLFNATLEVAHISDVTEEDSKRIDKAQQEIARKDYKKIKLYTEPLTFGQTLSGDLKRLMTRHHPDMIIMFRHEHNWLGRLFITSHTEQIAFETKVPLLAINTKKVSK